MLEYRVFYGSNRVHNIMRALACACVLLLLLHPLSTPQAGEVADKAVAAVNALKSAGKIGPNPVLRLVVKKGNKVNFTGSNFEVKQQWEDATGVQLDIEVMPQIASLELIRSNQDVDLTIARNREFPDLYHEDLLIDLTPLFDKYGFTLNSDSKSGFIQSKRQVYFGDKIIGVPADNDIALLYLRKDLLDSEDNKQAFMHKYGLDLKAPKTWTDYLRLVEFFHRPQQRFYGSLEPRAELTAWMFWMPRYLSKGVPVQPLFDENMQPLINSPEGIRATEEFIATIPFSPPKLLDSGNDYSFTLPMFRAGHGFSTIITPAGGKLFNMEGSPIRDKFAVYPMPGDVINNRLITHTTYIYGNNLVIPKHGSNSDLAFLYAMWLTDPDVSAHSVSATGGFSDPYRYNHLKHPLIREIYTPQLIDIICNQLSIAVPAGTGIPGDTEYFSVLNENLRRAATGAITAAQAMQLTATSWEVITEKYGRKQQLEHWRMFSQYFPK